jgi:HPt (histidine-containing phosphotransfer) domain-containing protein
VALGALAGSAVPAFAVWIALFTSGLAVGLGVAASRGRGHTSESPAFASASTRSAPAVAAPVAPVVLTPPAAKAPMGGEAAPRSAPLRAARMGPVVDGPALLDHLGGDRELVAELCGLLEIDTPDRLNELDTALRAGDAERVSRGAHALKGTFSAVFAVQARALAVKIEECGRHGRLGELTVEPAMLRAEVPAVVRELRAISQQAQA